MVEQLRRVEVRADAGKTVIVQHPAQFLRRVLRQAGEILIAKRRTKLNGLKARCGKALHRPGKIWIDRGANRIGLAADGQAQRIGQQGRDCGERDSSGRPLLKEMTSGHRHTRFSCYVSQEDYDSSRPVDECYGR
jgi:hypothetical protein